MRKKDKKLRREDLICNHCGTGNHEFGLEYIFPNPHDPIAMVLGRIHLRPISWVIVLCIKCNSERWRPLLGYSPITHTVNFLMWDRVPIEEEIEEAKPIQSVLCLLRSEAPISP